MDSPAIANALTDWLRSRQPATKHPSVQNLRESGAGYSNITWIGDYASSGIVLRLESRQSSVYPDADIVRQYRVLERLQDSAVPVPRLLGLEADAEVLGAPFYLMERVHGQVPNENPLYHQAGWFHDLPVAERRRHWYAGLDAVAVIARVDYRERGLEFLRRDPSRPPLESQLEYYRDAVGWAERLGRPYPHLRSAFDWLWRHQPQGESMALSWGDAKLGNCVFREGRVVAALDWEQATLANPVDDLAWWLMLDESLSDGYGVPRLAGLPSRAESIAYWERASGLRARDLPYYDVYAAWRMAYVMARIGTIFLERGWVKPQDEMDVRNGGATLLALHAERLGF